jgi:hypothetical protein
MRTFIPIHFLFASEPRRARLFAPLALLAAGLCAVPGLAAQPQAEIPKPAPAHRPAHPHKRAAAQAQSAATPAAEVPAQPETPKWPVNEKPALASVVWDSHGLRIEAQNSSLHQILEDVASATGAKVEGMGSDERIYGAYGPGQARDVLSQLLQGSGYNILMVGDQGQGAPRQIVLSSRHGAETPAQANGNPAGDQDDDADTEEPPPPAQTQPVRPAFAPGAQPRTPQQIMQEMQQRQQMMQQREQPVPPQPPPQ